jgi:GT2 family glycosyltransferase
MKKIQISVLTEGFLRKELSNLLSFWNNNNHFDLSIELTEDKPIEHCRNSIVQRFLASKNEWLIMIDNDVVPPQNMLELINLDKDILILPVPICQFNSIMYNVYLLDKEGYWEPVKNRKGLIEINSGGTGAIIIRRNILEKIEAPFERNYDKKGLAILGSDLFFCTKAKELGYRIYTHMDFVCSHYRTVDLKNWV